MGFNLKYLMFAMVVALLLGVARAAAPVLRAGAAAADNFTVEQRSSAYGPEVVLRDATAHTTAMVLPQSGFNCWRFTLSQPGGAPVEFLAGPADTKALAKGGCEFGWPILFPFPNRVAHSEFTFGGKKIRVGPGPDNAIHGLVHSQPWRVTNTSTQNGASVTGVTDTDSNPDLKKYWPWPCRLTVTYRLNGLLLFMTAVAENLGTEPMPFGFGVHPYHPLPLTPAGKRFDCQIQLPCTQRMELTSDCIPTGRWMTGQLFRKLRTIGRAALDDVFGGVELSPDGSACKLFDPAIQGMVLMRADNAFPYWVVFAPTNRDVICFEPYTCVTDAFNLHARGEQHTGFATLESGKPWRGTVTMSVWLKTPTPEKK